ncbi:CRISPR-associated helicase Cas3' [Streptomyces sp. NPDC001941]|uniref:CRISPR-associated helicase Cas3' n=1 Tax=Streptomyces sp. NPDC001941 TaxID=3154659 RepID=UPI00331D5937
MWAKDEGLKSSYSVSCHSLDTAAMAGELWDRALSASQRHLIADSFGVDVAAARFMVMFWAGLHDVGKCCWSFQAQPSGPMPTFLGTPGFEAPQGWVNEGAVRHERVTHLVLPQLLAPYGYSASCLPSRSPAQQVAQILGGHHGVFGRMLSRLVMADPGGAEPRVGVERGWVEARAALVELVYEACGRPVAPARVAPAGVAVLVTGLVVQADWLASRRSWVTDRLTAWEAGDRDHVAHFAQSVKAAAGAVDWSQLAMPVWRPVRSFADAFAGITRPYPLQEDIGRRLPGLVTGAGVLLVTAPAGDGKTETGLFAGRVMGAAAGRNGLLFLLPSRAATDAMWARLKDYVAQAAATNTPVTLVHGMAWRNADYRDDGGEDLVCEEGVSTTAGEFVRERHVGLLAGVAVATWDQAAMATLPVRYNALRWIAMSGKTVILDEAHAYDAYGHALTIRLLEWLGHLQVPVVLLSATLTGSVARRLITAYLTGAGHLDPQVPAPAYPGWLYADAASGEITASAALPSPRARRQHITTHVVRHTHDLAVTDGRARALATELAPLYDPAAEPGAVMIVCNTVSDAQHTERLLASLPGARRPRLLLVHAKMPDTQREDLLRELGTLLGPAATRPDSPLIVITTQLAEQSLDVDFDLVISDLAPLAWLFQRAGRGHRHTRPPGHRPAWARATQDTLTAEPQPHLIVLAPESGRAPHHWHTIYDAALLRATLDVLLERDGAPVAVPHELPALMERAYADLNTLADQALADDRARARTEDAHSAAAYAVAIPRPDRVSDLHQVTSRADGESGTLTTRLDADSVRALPVFVTPDGTRWLDAHCTRPLPLPDPGQRRLNAEHVADLIGLTLPVSARTLPAGNPETASPPAWKHTPTARDLRLIPHPVTADGTVQPYTLGARTLRLDPVLGLVSGPCRQCENPKCPLPQ